MLFLLSSGPSKYRMKNIPVFKLVVGPWEVSSEGEGSHIWYCFASFPNMNFCE